MDESDRAAMTRLTPSLAGLLSPLSVTVLVSNRCHCGAKRWCKGGVGSPGLALIYKGLQSRCPSPVFVSALKKKIFNNQIYFS